MPTIGLDCHLILDANGYWIDPTSYTCHRPRVHSAYHNRSIASGGLGVGQRHVDMGPDKRVWTFEVLAYQAMRDYAGNPITTLGSTFRTNLHTSYEKVNTTLAFTDPGGTAWTVWFVDLVEALDNARAQADSSELQWAIQIALVEA